MLTRKVEVTKEFPSAKKSKPLLPSLDSEKTSLREDEDIAILKGMLEYWAKKVTDPLSDISGFHEFMKESYRLDISKAQLVGRIGRLKKYQDNAEKWKNDEDLTFKKPHDKKSYELSQRIWASETAATLKAGLNRIYVKLGTLIMVLGMTLDVDTSESDTDSES